MSNHELPDPGTPLMCLICAYEKPWGVFAAATGAAVCIDCRDKARATVEPSRLVQDDDCHWYVIRLSEVDAFEKWLTAAPYWEGYEGPRFDDRMVDGPQSVSFKEFTTQ